MQCYVRGHVIKRNPAHWCPDEIHAELVAVPVRFVTFDGGISGGIVEIHRGLEEDVRDLFQILLAERFPLSSVSPIAEFGWDDECSMRENNTSGFHYRKIAGKDKLSHHAFGRAIDINPKLNPCIDTETGIVQPMGATYHPMLLGALHVRSSAVILLKSRGWEWGGDWQFPKDYQHFQKPL